MHGVNMEYVTNTLNNLWHQTAFTNLYWGNYLMIVIACIFLYLAIKKGYEPLLLIPIAFGMLLVNMYPDIMATPEETSNGIGGLLHYFFTLDEWSILPSLIFLGVGAMTDFGPLIANPRSFLLGAAAQIGIFSAYLMAILLGFGDKAAAAISIIGGADGPTSLFLCSKLGQTEYMGPIAVAAYSYMSLVPIIQPPIMKLFTTKKEREIKMEQLRPLKVRRQRARASLRDSAVSRRATRISLHAPTTSSVREVPRQLPTNTKSSAPRLAHAFAGELFLPSSARL